MDERKQIIDKIRGLIAELSFSLTLIPGDNIPKIDVFSGLDKIMNEIMSLEEVKYGTIPFHGYIKILEVNSGEVAIGLENDILNWKASMEEAFKDCKFTTAILTKYEMDMIIAKTIKKLSEQISKNTLIRNRENQEE